MEDVFPAFEGGEGRQKPHSPWGVGSTGLEGMGEGLRHKPIWGRAPRSSFDQGARNGTVP